MAAGLLGALNEHFLASDAYADFSSSGGLWFGDIPEEKPALPFLVIEHNGDVPSWTTEELYLEIGKLTVHLFAVGLATAEALAVKVKRVLDWCEKGLQVADALVKKVERKNTRAQLADFRAADGQVVYYFKIDYETLLCRRLVTPRPA